MADQNSRKGSSHANAEILNWLDSVHGSRDGALAAAFDAPARFKIPPIQIGPAEGRLMALLVGLIGARKVVEIGTLAGYSTIHLARALPANGKLWTIEREPRHAAVARKCLKKAGLAGRVTLRVGAALDILPTLEVHAPFDFVFIDADKRNYAHYGRWAAEHLRPGGLMLGDNAFLFGRLLDRSAEAQAMRRWHEDSREAFETVCVPTPDGLLLGIRR